MKPITRAVLVLAAALVVAGVVYRQQGELDRLRAVVAELTTSLPREEAATSTVSNPLPVDIEELRRDAAEVHSLRDEIAGLRREKVEAGALQARIDKLTRDASAILNQWPDFLDNFGDFNYPAPSTSPLVFQASSLARSSPEEAARWVAALPPGQEQERAALAVVNHWTGTDPTAAAAWTTQFPEGPLRERAMSLVARGWGLHDWNATAGWLEELPMGSSRDAAIGAFVTSADGYNIKLALEWANRMEAPESRAMRVEQTAERWLREDNAAARAWIEKAQLPPGVAERLLSAK